MTEQERQAKIARALREAAAVINRVQQEIADLDNLKNHLALRHGHLMTLAEEFEAGRYRPAGSDAKEASGDAEPG